MLSNVTYGTRRSSNRSSFDINNQNLSQQSSQALRLLQKDKNDLFYTTKQIPIADKTYTSSTSVVNLLREIRANRELKQRQNQWRKSETYKPEFEFLNKKTKEYERKYKVYEFFNKPKTFWPLMYHMLVFFLVFTCLILTVFSTIEHFSAKASQILLILEKIIIVWFFSEFCLRLWSASCKQRYDGWKGKWTYMRVPSHLLDFIVIITSAAVLIAGIRDGNAVFSVSAFRGFHRLFQVFQILTLHRSLQPWKLLVDVMYDQMHQLLIMLYIQIMTIIVLAYLSYMLERDAPGNQFSNLAEAMWWAVVTLSTVGYGDRVHVTWWGKLISSLFTLLGVALFALPAGIIGAGLAIRVEKEESETYRRKKRLAATLLMQAMWRLHKANQSTDNITNNYDNKSNNIFMLNSSERIIFKFIRLTQFFLAKRKFKLILKIFDLDNNYKGYKHNQSDVYNGIKHINEFVDTIDKRVDYNESQIIRTESDLEKRLENIRSLIDYIGTEMKRQNKLMDFISVNMSKQNNITKLDQFLNIKNQNKRHNRVVESEFRETLY